MPTDDQVNASESDVSTETQQTTPEITDDLIKSHPLYQDLQEKHSAARTGMDAANVELKKLKQIVVGEPAEESTEQKPATQDDLAKTTAQLKWELKNEKQIELANKNGKYDEYVQSGENPEKALKLALFDEGITNDASRADSQRQAAASSAAPGVDRSSNTDIEGLPKSYVEKLKAQGLKDDQIRTIVKNANARAARR